MFTDSDNFGVTFPIDLDVKVKSVLGNIFNFSIHFIADHFIEEDSLEKLFLVELVGYIWLDKDADYKRIKSVALVTNFKTFFPFSSSVMKIVSVLINYLIKTFFQMKATLLGATFLIDFMYFEKQNNGG